MLRLTYYFCCVLLLSAPLAQADDQVCLLSFQLEVVSESALVVGGQEIRLEFAEVVFDCSEDLNTQAKEILEELELEGEPQNVACACTDQL